MATSWLGRAIFASCLGTGAVACTLLTGVGDLSVDDGAADAAPRAIADTSTPAVTNEAGTDVQDAGDLDASLFGDVNRTTVDACSPSGCLPVPDGFVYVALGPKGADCPTDFGTPVDVVEDETVDPSACSCGCAITAGGKCAGLGQIADFVGDPDASAGTCTDELGSLTAGTDCQVDGYLGAFEKARYRKYVPPLGGPQGITCAGNTNKDVTRVDGQSERICTAAVVPACNALVCPSDPGGSFKACIATSGTVACPKEWPVSHAVGTGVSFDCDGSGCGCSATGQCSGGTLSFYTSATCTGTAGFTVPVNGSCATSAMADGTTVYRSHRYAPNPPANVKCAATGSAPVTNTTVAQASTVCCTN